MKPDRRRWTSKRARVVLAFASLLGTLLVLEIVFRTAGMSAEFHAPPDHRVIRNPNAERDPVGFFPDSTIITRYSSDPRNYFGDSQAIEHRFNSVGWRDVEHSVEKPAGTLRILGLGDSYLYGQGVRREDICLSQLEQRLNSESDLKVECINAGISAFNTRDQLDQLRERGLSYSPDLVLLHFVLNDVEQDVYRQGPKVEFYADYIEIYRQPDLLSGYSALWGWSRQRYLRMVTARDYIAECASTFSVDSPDWQSCRQALQSIQRLCNKNDCKLVVVIFPFFVSLDDDYPFAEIHDVVTTFCRGRGIRVLDLQQSYQKFRGPELWVHPTDQHPNEQAHAIAADTIASYLLRNKDDLLRGGTSDAP